MNDDITDFITKWNKQSKQDVLFSPQDKALKSTLIPFGIPALDAILGGGVPRGRNTLIYGEPGVGKTLMAQLLIASAEREGGTALYVDAERCYDESWFKLTGVDTNPSKLLVARPRSTEQAFDLICDAIEDIHPDVIVVDSIPALVPQSIMSATMEEKDFQGLEPRKITAGVKKVTLLNQSSAMVYINQTRSQMGVVWGNPESLPGGKALRYHASLFVRVRAGKWLTTAGDEEEFAKHGDTKRTGFVLKLRTEKNKLAPPFQECELDFRFTGEVDGTESLVDLAVQKGVIQKAGAGFYTLPELGRVRGIEEVKKILKQNHPLRDLIIKGVVDE